MFLIADFINFLTKSVLSVSNSEVMSPVSKIKTFFICTTFKPMGVMCLHARMFCTVTHTSSIPLCAMYLYMQERSVHSLIQLLFPWVQCIYTCVYMM